MKEGEEKDPSDQMKATPPPTAEPPATAATAFLAIKFKRLAVSSTAVAADQKPSVRSTAKSACESAERKYRGKVNSAIKSAKLRHRKCAAVVSKKTVATVVLRQSKLTALAQGTVNSEANIFGNDAADILEDFAGRKSCGGSTQSSCCGGSSIKSRKSSFTGESFTDLSVSFYLVNFRIQI